MGGTGGEASVPDSAASEDLRDYGKNRAVLDFPASLPAAVLSMRGLNADECCFRQYQTIEGIIREEGDL